MEGTFVEVSSLAEQVSGKFTGKVGGGREKNDQTPNFFEAHIDFLPCFDHESEIIFWKRGKRQFPAFEVEGVVNDVQDMGSCVDQRSDGSA